MGKCGIYAIENLVNGKVYIGLSRDIKDRFKKHKNLLKRGCHSNLHLQNAWNEQCEQDFKFIILEICPESKLNDKEIFYMDLYQEKTETYNFRSGGSSGVHSEETKLKMKENHADFKGIKRSAETKEKIRLARLGYSHSEETRRKISETKKNPSEETRKKLSRASKGRTHSEETKIKLSETLRNRIFTEEHREKLSKAAKNMSKEHRQKLREANLGRKATEETRKKLRESHKGYVMPEEQKAKIGKASLGRKLSEESKKKISEANKGRVVSDETRKRLSETHKGNILTEEQKRKQSESMKEYWIKKKQGAII